LPTVLWTLLLGFAILYWLIAGFTGLGHGDVDGVVDGVADGAIHGAVEGAAHGVADAAHPVADAAGLLHRLNLRSVPLTVLASILVVINFFVCHLVVFTVGGTLDAVLPSVLWRILLLVVVFFLSLPLAGIAVRPLRPLFQTVAAPSPVVIEQRLTDLMASINNLDLWLRSPTDGGNRDS
jgi:hypothetical protein